MSEKLEYRHEKSDNKSLANNETENYPETEPEVETHEKNGCCGDCSFGISCCFASRSCHLCCGCLPPIKQSISSKIMYTLFLIVFTAGAAMLNSSGFQQRIKDTSNFQSFCDFLTGGDTGEFTVECAEIFSFSGVYMVYLSLAFFFVFMAIITINIRHSKQFRAKLHNGFWFWKILILLGLLATVLFTIDGQQDGATSDFITYWKWIALGFGSLFIVWQTIVLVKFSYTWSSTWYRAAIESNSKVSSFFWKFSLWAIGLLFVAFACLANYLMVMIFTNNPSNIRDETGRQTNCETNYWFIISTAAGSGLILFLSLVPCQTRGYEYRTATTGILRSGIIIAQITYAAFTTVNSQMPVNGSFSNGTECTERCFYIPDYLKDIVGGINVSDISTSDLIDELNAPCNFGSRNDNTTTIQTTLNAFAIALTLFLTIYSAFNSSAITKTITKKKNDEAPMFCCCMNFDYASFSNEFKQVDVKGQDVILDDYPTLTYRYWAFHLIYACASMYLMMTMTNWFEPATTLESAFQKGDKAGFYIQGATTLLILVIYLLALVAPLFCPGSSLAGQLESDDIIVDSRPSSPRENQVSASIEDNIQNSGPSVLVVSETNEAVQMNAVIPAAGKMPEKPNNKPLF